METLNKAIQKESKKSKSGDKESIALLDVYKKVEVIFNQGNLAIANGILFMPILPLLNTSNTS